MRLGPTNQIVDDSEFKWRNPSDLKSDIKIGFRLKDHVDFLLNSTNSWLKSMDFNLFLTIFDKKLIKKLGRSDDFNVD